MANQKTAITVLQEMMVKQGSVPEYECVSQTGPDHCKAFEYKCLARGFVTSAWARSKKEAKQDAARLMLLKLSGKNQAENDEHVDHNKLTEVQSHVVLLKELCDEYHLPAVEYELVGDTGPPHDRQFTVRAKLSQTERVATATTKKTARQKAASMLYSYLRNNLSKITKDFVEEDALVRAHEKVMKRYTEVKDNQSWKPDLGQKISEYHLGIVNHIEPEKCKSASNMLKEQHDYSIEVLERLCAQLELTLRWDELDSVRGAPLPVLLLTPTSPPLAFSGQSREEAVRSTMDYLRTSLDFQPTRVVTPLDEDAA